jgi:hypothetical protein
MAEDQDQIVDKEKQPQSNDGIEDVELNKSIKSNEDGDEDEDDEDDDDHDMDQTNPMEQVYLEIAKEDQEKLEKNKNIDTSQWNAKVARYLAYSVDGGILCSQFTLTRLITFL